MQLGRIPSYALKSDKTFMSHTHRIHEPTTNTRLAVQLWRVPRYALKTAGAAAAPLLQPLGQALPHWFAASSHSAVLYMVAEMVKVFGREPAHHPVLGEVPDPCLRMPWLSCSLLCPSAPMRSRIFGASLLMWTSEPRTDGQACMQSAMQKSLSCLRRRLS